MPKRNQAHMEGRRRQILDAATACFRAEGFDNTTMKDIAERADLSVGSLYTHYKNKADVITALVEHQKGWGITSGISSLNELTDFLEQATKDLTGENIGAYSVNVQIVREAMNNQKLRAVLCNSHRAVYPVFVKVLMDLQKESHIRPDYDVEVGAFRIYAAAMGIIIWHYQDEEIAGSQVRAFFKDEIGRMRPVTEVNISGLSG